MITELIKRHEVLLPIDHNRYNFREKEQLNTKCIKLRNISLAETLAQLSIC